MIATTATEAAMYDEQVNGLLRTKMTSLSHKNLPLAMFLEVGDLGYPAWKEALQKQHQCRYKIFSWTWYCNVLQNSLSHQL